MSTPPLAAAVVEHAPAKRRHVQTPTGEANTPKKKKRKKKKKKKKRQTTLRMVPVVPSTTAPAAAARAAAPAAAARAAPAAAARAAPAAKKRAEVVKMTEAEKRARKNARDRARRRAVKEQRSSSDSAVAAEVKRKELEAKFEHCKSRVTPKTFPEILTMESVAQSDETIAAETAAFNRTQHHSGIDAWLEAEVDGLLDAESGDTPFNLATSVMIDKYRVELPRFRRKEEEEFLKECSPTSPDVCQMREHCESVRISKKRGVNPSIYLPHVKKTNSLMCLMCMRHTATSQLLRLRMDRTGFVRSSTLQKHANFVDCPGEYRWEDMLCTRADRWEGIALPVLQHRENSYAAMSAVLPDGTRRRYWCQEKGYPLPDVDPTAARGNGGASSSSSSSSGSFL